MVGHTTQHHLRLCGDARSKLIWPDSGGIHAMIRLFLAR